MTCAAGSQPEVLCAVVASHLSYCPACLRKVSNLSEVGVALFEHLEPVPLAPSGSGNWSDRRVAPPPDELSWSGHGKDIPGPLTRVLGESLDDLDWDALTPGIESFKVDISEGAIGDLRLFKVAPRQSLRWRNTSGEQLVMLLRGRCSGSKGKFEPGDFEEFDEPGDYSVVANTHHDCVILLASECEPLFHVEPAIGTKSK